MPHSSLKETRFDADPHDILERHEPSEVQQRNSTRKNMVIEMKDFRSVKVMEQIHGVKWKDLVEVEPELNELLEQARMVGAGCRRWSDVERGWGQFKGDISRMAGFCGMHRLHPVLGTMGAYNVVYWKLHNAVARDRRGDS